MATMLKFLALVLCCVTVTAKCSITAYCNIANSTYGVAGSLTVKQNDDSSCVTVTGDISGLAPGGHGFHVHEFSDISNDCMNTGPHYNPCNKTHGGPEDEERHIGDLGNIDANDEGVALVDIKDGKIKLCGKYSIVNRTLVVHEKEDDLGRGNNTESKINGNSGKRLGCCVVTVN